MQPLYKRVLIKLSGEGLMGDKAFGMSPVVLKKLAADIKKVYDLGVEICIVVGGGNIFRGASEASQGINRSVADQVGMLGTVMNALYVQDALEKVGVPVRVMSGLNVPQVCEPYMYRKALKHFERKRVIIFAGGTGSPYFTTDTAAALRASEMQCDALLKATQVDGVYTADPKKDPKAKRYDKVSYDEVLKKNLRVMDLTAITLVKESRIPIVVFELKNKDAFLNAVCGKGKFTTIEN
ncbi:MAG TPA: UMP kinase [Alphaproteobacteria bacterium]|nr:UMP kinase [Alphaproteobacteria bacterium]